MKTHIQEITKLEKYLCNLLKINQHDLHLKIMDWAINCGGNIWNTYESLTRNGEVAKCLKFYILKNMNTVDMIKKEKTFKPKTKKILSVLKT